MGKILSSPSQVFLEQPFEQALRYSKCRYSWWPKYLQMLPTVSDARGRLNYFQSLIVHRCMLVIMLVVTGKSGAHTDNIPSRPHVPHSELGSLFRGDEVRAAWASHAGEKWAEIIRIYWRRHCWGFIIETEVRVLKCHHQFIICIRGMVVLYKV